MTKKEFLTAVAAGMMNEDIMTVANEMLEKMDAEADSRKAKDAERRAAKTAARLEAEKPIMDAILAALTDEPKTAAELIADAGVEITPQKFAQMMRGPITDGTVAKEMVKGEKGKVTGYKVA